MVEIQGFRLAFPGALLGRAVDQLAVLVEILDREADLPFFVGGVLGDDVRAAAANGLRYRIPNSNIKDRRDELVEPLIEAFGDSDRRVRLSIAEALGQFRYERCLPPNKQRTVVDALVALAVEARAEARGRKD